MKGITKEDIFSGRHKEKVFFKKERLDQRYMYIKWTLIILLVIVPYFGYNFISEKISIAQMKTDPINAEGILEEKIQPQTVLINGLNYTAYQKTIVSGFLVGYGNFCPLNDKRYIDAFSIVILKIRNDKGNFFLTSENDQLREFLRKFKARSYIEENYKKKVTIWGRSLVSRHEDEKRICVDAIQFGDDFYPSKAE